MGDEEADTEAGKPAEGKAGKKKKKKQKLKSAWIGFFGRIVAQVVGAAATVGLGIMLVRSQMVAPTPPAPSPTPTPRAIGQQRSVEEIFALFDVNRDDRLAPTEVPAEMWPRMARADTDGDGLVSSAELREARARAIPPPGKR